jgi:hypothetical protein
MRSNKRFKSKEKKMAEMETSCSSTHKTTLKNQLSNNHLSPNMNLRRGTGNNSKSTRLSLKMNLLNLLPNP